MTGRDDVKGRATWLVGRTDTRAHLERLRETDSELDAKAEAWVAYFERHGVRRSREAVLESWARLGADRPGWPLEVKQ